MSIYHAYIHPRMSDVFSILAERIITSAPRAPKAPNRIFLSRSRWTDNQRIVQQAELDEIFSGLGFTVVHPQTMTTAHLLSLDY